MHSTILQSRLIRDGRCTKKTINDWYLEVGQPTPGLLIIRTPRYIYVPFYFIMLGAS